MYRLHEELERLGASLGGEMGVAARDLGTGAEVALSADRPFPLASVFKVPLMVAVLQHVDRGDLTLDERVRLREDAKSPGGILTFCAAGLLPTVADLLHFMIAQSDNTATDMLWSLIGREAVNEAMRRLGLSDIDCALPNREFFLLEAGACPSYQDLSPSAIVELVRDARERGRLDGLLAAVRREGAELDGPGFQRLIDERFGYSEELDYERGFIIDQQLDNLGTPQDVLELLAMIVHGRCASQASCRLMVDILCRQEWRDRIPAGLPEGTRVGNKTGSVGGTVNDAALAWRPDGSAIAIVVFCKGLSHEASTLAPDVVAQVAGAVWRHFTKEDR